MQLTLKFNVFLCSLLCLFALSQASAAKFYKWTDEAGNIHYSDKEPVGVDSTETVNINASNTSETVNKLPTFEINEDSELSPEEQKAQQEKEAKLKEYCTSLTKNIKTLEIGGRIKTVDTDGNQKFLSSDEQQAKIKRYQKQYSERCASLN